MTRTKVFGPGPCRPLDRNTKAKLAFLARSMSIRKSTGKHWGPITAKHLAVFLSLLYVFHNTTTGRTFPSYARLAEASHCANSTVGAAIQALEAVGLITWSQRVQRVRVPEPSWLGGYALRTRILRTSNAYVINDITATHSDPQASNTEDRRGTTNQAQIIERPEAATLFEDGLKGSLERLRAHVQREAALKGLSAKKV